MRSRSVRIRPDRRIHLSFPGRLEDRRLLATFTVVNTDDSGPGSLRQAILDADVAGDGSTVAFDIPGSGVQTISPTSDLPSISAAITIDGTTQPGARASTNPVGQADNAWYSVDQVEDCTVVSAGGQIDQETAPALHDALQVAAEFSTKVILDLSEVTMLDSAGLDVLAQAREQIRRHQGSVVLVSANEEVRTSLQRAGLPQAFLVVERVAEAIAALGRMRNEP